MVRGGVRVRVRGEDEGCAYGVMAASAHLSRCGSEHELDQIHTCDLLSHGMLHLQP